jgi:hypothetical protein
LNLLGINLGVYNLKSLKCEPSKCRCIIEMLIIVRVIVIMVPFIALFVLDAVSFLAPIFNSVMGISVADNINQVSTVLILDVLLRWTDAAG